MPELSLDESAWNRGRRDGWSWCSSSASLLPWLLVTTIAAIAVAVWFTPDEAGPVAIAVRSGIGAVVGFIVFVPLVISVHVLNLSPIRQRDEARQQAKKWLLIPPSAHEQHQAEMLELFEEVRERFTRCYSNNGIAYPPSGSQLDAHDQAIFDGFREHTSSDALWPLFDSWNSSRERLSDIVHQLRQRMDQASHAYEEPGCKLNLIVMRLVECVSQGIEPDMDIRWIGEIGRPHTWLTARMMGTNYAVAFLPEFVPHDGNETRPAKTEADVERIKRTVEDTAASVLLWGDLVAEMRDSARHVDERATSLQQRAGVLGARTWFAGQCGICVPTQP